MGTLKYSSLPLLLASVPLFVFALVAISQAQIFDWLRGTADCLETLFFLGPVLFYDWIGLIHFNILGGTPELWGSFWLAEALYAASSSFILFWAGKLILKFFGPH
jgi:hypothetical protein